MFLSPGLVLASTLYHEEAILPQGRSCGSKSDVDTASLLSGKFETGLLTDVQEVRWPQAVLRREMSVPRRDKEAQGQEA